ncbi:MAG TPA: YaiO family outer membrane beta-barrel protein [Woeseiaceae bacterium]
MNNIENESFAPARRGSVLLALLFSSASLFSVATAAETPCRTATSMNSEQAAAEPDSAERFQRARTLAQQGDFEGAVVQYGILTEQHPDHVDYLFGEAQARFWSGDSRCALQSTTRARQLAPDYEEVWRLEYQILQSNFESASSERLDVFRTTANARFPSADWLRQDLKDEAPRYRWEFGFNRESLDNGAADWQNVYVHMDRRTANDSVVSVALTEYRRFSRTDIETSIGGGLTVAGTWLLDAAVRVSPSAEFLPETVVDAGVSRLLGNGWIAGFDLRHRRFPDDTVNTFGLNFEHYFGSFRAAYHIDNTRLASSASFTHRGVLNYYTESGTQYGLTIAAGDEVEIVAPGQLLEMDISAVALSGRHPLSERFSILWRVGTHRQGSIYRRNNVGLSIAGEF